MTLKLHKPSRIFAEESIQTQTDGFGERLERLVVMLVKEINDTTAKVEFSKTHPVIKEIEKVIFGRFGLKVDMITDEHLAAILPFYSNLNHIFIPDFFRGYLNIRDQTKMLKNFDKRKGTVNAAKATVSGIFSEYEHPLYINFFELVRGHKFTATDITACMLHELGHAFEACAYADRSDRTNQVLATIARHLIDKETGDVEFVYRELATVTNTVTKEAVDKMLNGPKVVAGATWFKTIVGIVRSQTLNDTYNATSFEQLADGFASRFGYGKAIVLALDKLHRFGAEKNKSIQVLGQLLSATLTVMLAAMIFGLLGTGSIGLAMILVFYKFVFLCSYREDMVDYTYDKLKIRYMRIRQDAIDQLKNTKLKKEKIQDLLDNIYTLDTIIRETAVVTTLPGMISNFIFSGARHAEKSITDQQLMEALASNDLFLQSAEFRHNA